MAPIGLVLAGGVGSRLGRPKGDLLVDGRRLAVRAAEALGAVCDRVMISIRRGTINPAPGYPAIEDAPPNGRGPIAGIAAAFAATGDRDLLVLACDYPRVEVAILASLLRVAAPEHDLVLPVDSAGRDHPLVALWRGRTAPAARAALGRRRYRVSDLVDELAVRRVTPAELGPAAAGPALVNLNRPGDLVS